MFDQFVIVFILSVFLLAAVQRMLPAKVRRFFVRGFSKSGPVLLSHYTAGGAVQRLDKGKIDNLHYQVFLASKPMVDLMTGSSHPAQIIRVELPFRTKVHLIGVSKEASDNELLARLKKPPMEPVDLEANYSDYFHLYAEHGQQFESRYHMNPSAMVFTIDFCRSHNWEIIHDELYFAQNTENKAEDGSLMFEDVLPFVEAIRPAIEIKNSFKQNHIRTPYGEDRRHDLPCPHCGALLENQGDGVFICPAFHGYLLNPKVLGDIRTGKRLLEQIPFTHKEHKEKQISCPSCGSKMLKVDYALKQVIDSCTNCHYRWIDAHELKHITQK